MRYPPSVLYDSLLLFLVTLYLHLALSKTASNSTNDRSIQAIKSTVFPTIPLLTSNIQPLYSLPLANMCFGAEPKTKYYYHEEIIPARRYHHHGHHHHHHSPRASYTSVTRRSYHSQSPRASYPRVYEDRRYV